MEAVIFVGIQATGRSSLYQRFFSDSHLRINLDMLHTRHREEVLLGACIEAKQPLVIDNTNTTVRERARYIEPLQAAGFRIICYYFQSKIN
ncbi:MAG TPA: AAA family ATPase [Blastocatellia bacterium]|jgi:hypothetical protein|nr:AAA family ATPase [Blastocatellia bacterium]